MKCFFYCVIVKSLYCICRYTASSRYMKMGYEEEFLTCLQSIIGEVERKIRRGYQRLALNQSHSNVGFWTCISFRVRVSIKVIVAL